VSCDTCDGDGEDDEGNPCEECQGGGRVECEYCEGRGEYTCEDCMGYEIKPCPKCDGNGYIRTDDVLYEYYDICTWSNYLNDRCELKEGTYEVVLSYDDFIDLSEDYIVMEVSTKNAMFIDKVQKDNMYCTYYSDSPSLKISGHQSYPTIGILKNFNDLAPYLE
jgi:RecJ-like exonuclease